MKYDYIHNYLLKGVKTIGIIGTDNISNTSELIYHLLDKCNISATLIGKRKTKINKKEYEIKFNLLDSIEYYKYIYEMWKEKVQVLIIEIPVDYRLDEYYSHIKFDIILHTNIQSNNLYSHMNLENYIHSKKELFNKLSDKEIIVINADDENGLKLLGRNKYTPVITYGLSNRATITASSIDIYNFNYCIQRTILTLSGEEIEASEYPITINLSDKYNIYNCLAVITCGLLIDISIEDINKSFRVI